MLEDFELSHLVAAFLVVTVLVVGGLGYYWATMIDQAGQLTRDSYECSGAYNVSSIPYPPADRAEARRFVLDYLDNNTVNVSPDDLAISATNGTYRVGLPRVVWSGNTCTFRDAGTDPPACIGRYFEFSTKRLKMAYEQPCEWTDG